MAQADAPPLDTEAARRTALVVAQAHLLRLHREGMPQNPNAIVWAQPHFRQHCVAIGVPDDDDHWSPTPSTSEYRSPDDDFIKHHLTPHNAVCADLTIVHTQDTNVPTLRQHFI